MNKKTEDLAKDLLSAVGNNDIKQEAKEAQRINQVDLLRNDIFEFFKERMSKIKESETLKAKAQEALESQLDTGELNFSQIMTIFNAASRESRNSSEAIINLFKPVPGTNSILADSLGKSNDDDDYESIFESMSQDELRKIDGLHKLLKELAKKEKLEN